MLYPSFPFIFFGFFFSFLTVTFNASIFESSSFSLSLFFHLNFFPFSSFFLKMNFSFPGAFFWGLKTASSCWGPDLENRMCAEAILNAIHVVLLSLQSACDRVHCLSERELFLLHLWPFFDEFFLQMHQLCYIIFALDGFSFLKVIDEQNTLHILKYGVQKLACWCLHLWSLWTGFTCCYPLSWLPIWL